MADPRDFFPQTPISTDLNTFGQEAPAPVGEQKKERVAQTAQAKRDYLGGSPLQAATAVREGNDMSQDWFLQEVQTKTIDEIAMSYGTEAADAARQFHRTGNYLALQEAQQRTDGQIAGDSALGVVTGAARGLGGIAAFGTGLVSDAGGAYVAEKTDDAANWLKGNQSDILQEERRLQGVRSQLDREDIAAQYERDVADGKSFAGLRRFGREFMAAGSDLVQNPALAGDLAAEGVGSLISSGGIAKVASTAAAKVILAQRGLTGAAASQFLATPAGREFTQRVMVGTMPGAIGALEGGGAYAQIQAEIQRMSEAELMEGSPEYRDLRASGLGHDEARNRIANIAGLEGGAIQGIVGAVTGKLVAKFEADPLGLSQIGRSGSLTQSFRNVGQNLLKEGLEETLQETSAEGVTGAMVQRYADENRDPFEGLGQAAATGLVAGIGTAGAVQAPRTAADATIEGTLAAGRGAAAFVKSRVDAAEAAADAESTVGTEAVQQATQTLDSTLGKFRAPAAPVAESTLAPEGQPTTGESVPNVEPAPVAEPQVIPAERVSQLLDISGAEINALPAGIQKTFNEAGDPIADTDIISRGAVLSAAMSEVKAGKMDPADLADTALWLNDQANQMEALLAVDATNLTEDQKADLEAAKEAVNTILGSAEIKTARERAASVTSADLAPLPEITEENANSPEVAKAVRSQASLARSNPAGVDPKFVSTLLNQKSVSLPDNVKKSLTVALQIAEEAAVNEQQKIDSRKTAGISIPDSGNFVRDQILKGGKQDQYDQWGLTKHAAEIVQAVEQGDQAKAEMRLNNLRNFAEHMQNKLNAARESYALKKTRPSENRVEFRTWTGSRWIEPGTKGASAIGINHQNAASVQLGRDVAIDAASVAKTYNSLLAAYEGVLNGVPVEFTEMDGSLDVIQAATTVQEAANVTEEQSTEEGSGEAQSTAQEGTGEAGPEADGTDGTDTRGTEEDTVAEEAPADPETETTGEAEPEAGVEPDLTFDNLPKRADGISRFNRAFKIDPKKSGLMAEESPLEGVITKLRTFDEEASSLDYPMDLERRRSLAILINTQTKRMIDKVNARLNQKQKALTVGTKKDGTLRTLTPLEALQQTKVDFTGQKIGFALNLVDTTTGKYDQRLVEAAAIAAVDWAMNTQPIGSMDYEDVAREFGISEDQVTRDHIWAANRGIGMVRAKESLATTILQYWGSVTNSTAPDSDVRGISEALAIELLLAMEGELITRAPMIKGQEAGEGNPFVVEIKHPNTERQVKDLVLARDFLSDVYLIEKEKPVAINEEIKGPVTRTKASPGTSISKTIEEAVKAQRKIVHKLNTGLFDLMSQMGREKWLKLRGWKEVDPEFTHPKDLESIEGKNRALERSWDETQLMVGRIFHRASEDGIDPSEVEVRFDYKVASNDRIMAQGFNGQADKTLREVLAPTIGTLDLTKEEDLQLFWLTIAQSTDLMKVEKDPHEMIFERIDEKVMETYPQSMEVLRTWVREGEISEEQWQVVLDEIQDGTDKLLHALITLARYQVALGNNPEELKAFQSHLSLEADGKTDGPINAMVHFILGAFTGEQLQSYAKGGFFVNEDGMTLNDWVKRDKKDLYETAADKAQYYAENLKEGLKDHKNKAVLVPQMEAMQRMVAIVGEVEIEGGNLIIGRKALKNPLTISMYGSTAGGMASKTAAAISDVIYANLSKMMKEGSSLDEVTYDRFWADLKLLAQNQAVITAKGDAFVTDVLDSGTKKRRKAPLKDLGTDYKKFSLSAENMEMLTANVTNLYVAPLMEAINDTTHGAIETMKVIQASTQAQSVIFLESFQNAVTDAIKTAVREGTLKAGESLSRKAYEAVYVELLKTGAVVESVSGSNNDSFHLNLSRLARSTADGHYDSKVKVQNKEFSRGFGNEYSGEGGVMLPKTAGVSASPMVTISRGDARMMILYFASKDPSLKVQAVFDGLEIAPDMIKQVSEQINKAVADGWAENPLVTIEESFNDFLKQNLLGLVRSANTLDGIWDALSQAYVDQIWVKQARAKFDNVAAQKGLSLPERKDAAERLKALEAATPEQVAALKELVKDELMGMRDRLKTMRQEAQARREALDGVTSTIDHMAGAKAPYVRKGDLIENLPKDVIQEEEDAYAVIDEGKAPQQGLHSFNALAEFLEIKRKAALDRIRKEEDKAANRPAVQKPDAAFLTDLKRIGRPVRTRGEQKVAGDVTKLSIRAVKELMKQTPQSRTMSGLYEVMEKSLPRFTVLVGTAAELNAYRNQFYPELADADPIELAQTDLANGIIYLANAAPETMLHELLHATTSAVMFDFYENPDKLSEEQKAAVQNLESLMTQFMGLDFSAEPVNVQDVVRTVRGEIRAHMRNLPENVGKTAALQEFVAWSLTNQNLADSLRTTKVRTPLMKLAHSVLMGLRKLLGLPSGQMLDMFSNIQWNTGALIQMSGRNRQTAAQRRAQAPTGLLLDQVSPNSDQALKRAQLNFEQKIGRHIRGLNPVEQTTESVEVKAAANETINRVMSSGFTLDPQQASYFRSMQAALASTMQMDPGAMMKAQEIFDATIKGLSVEDLMDNPEPDANGNQDPNDRAQAQEKFNLLVGKYGNQANKQGRSDILATFIGLSQVDPNLRKALSKVQLPKKLRVGVNQSLDENLENLAENLMNKLSDAVIGGDAKGKDASVIMDKLAKILAAVEEDDRTVYEAKAQEFLTEGDNRVSGMMSKGAEWVTNAVTPMAAKAEKESIKKLLLGGVGVIEALVTQDKVKQRTAVEMVSSVRNNAPKLVPDFMLKLVDEVMGITDENRGMFSLMNPVKSGVSRIRQIFRTDMPKLLEKQFSRKLTVSEWGQLHLGLARTDLAALGKSLRIRNIREMLVDKAKLDLAINEEHETLKGLAQKGYEKVYMEKAKDLAKFMTTYEIDSDNHMLARNALTIAMLPSKGGATVLKPSPELVDSIDRLTSLYALEMLDPAVSQSLKTLTETESKGVEFLLYYLTDLRAKEEAKATDISRMNGFKGYVPSEVKDGVSLMVMPDSEHNIMVAKGYTRLGDYKGSGFEAGRMGYYFSNVGGHSVFHQGIMQTVHSTSNGVDAFTGRTLTGLVAGKIPDADVGLIEQKIQKGQVPQGKEALLPVYDTVGTVIGYERSLDPEMIRKMNKNDHLGEMIGAWAGRHVEEAVAQEFNSKLVQALRKMWDKDKATRKGEYIDLSDPKQTNAIEQDAWKLIPKQTKEEIKRVFGDEGFMVRKSELDNAVGYRGFSIGEAWTGVSNIKPEHKKLIRDVSTAFLGKNAFKYLVTAQKGIQAGVGVAKNIIVVLSIVVPVANMASNIQQLITLGVSPRDLWGGSKLKLTEVERVQKYEKRLAELPAFKARYRNDEIQLRKIEAEEKSINDAIDRLSIAPLYRTGEFTTIAEGETEVDAAIANGTWVEKIKEYADRLPAKAGTVGRYAAITKDTALFKGLARSVQYGDFIAKSILYDHLTKREGKSHEEAMKQVIDEFVAYNFLPSRGRSYLESIGLSWFWAYKLRSIKVAQRMLRDHPLRVLMAGAGGPLVPDLPGVNVGSPLTDNAVGVILEGNAGYTIGPDMLFRAPSMHPVSGLMF